MASSETQLVETTRNKIMSAIVKKDKKGLKKALQERTIAAFLREGLKTQNAAIHRVAPSIFGKAADEIKALQDDSPECQEMYERLKKLAK